MKSIQIRITFLDELLGMLPDSEDIFRRFIAAKAPDSSTSADDEADALEADIMDNRQSVHIFPKRNGRPFLYDYQMKGFMKDACSALRKVPGSESGKIRAYRKEIDGLIFVTPREIPLHFCGEIGTCARPLRASTAQGDRIAMAISETVPAGTYMECTITCLSDSHMAAVHEWLDYGSLRGMGEWRNSGKGRFEWAEIPE